MSKLGLAAGRPSENRKQKALAELSKTTPQTVRVNFELSEELHMQLKLHAVKSRRTISELLREWIESKLSQESN